MKTFLLLFLSVLSLNSSASVVFDIEGSLIISEKNNVVIMELSTIDGEILPIVDSEKELLDCESGLFAVVENLAPAEDGTPTYTLIDTIKCRLEI